MYDKRLRCKKCGRTLLTGFTKNVESITCTCGAVVYPNDKDFADAKSSERRHKKNGYDT